MVIKLGVTLVFAPLQQRSLAHCDMPDWHDGAAGQRMPS